MKRKSATMETTTAPGKMEQIMQMIGDLQRQVAGLSGQLAEQQRCRHCHTAQHRRQHTSSGQRRHTQAKLETGKEGKIKFYSLRRAYGFITRADGKGDVFFHRTALAAGPRSTGQLEAGVAVIFSVRGTRKGPEAADVRVMPGDPCDTPTPVTAADTSPESVEVRRQPSTQRSNGAPLRKNRHTQTPVPASQGADNAVPLVTCATALHEDAATQSEPCGREERRTAGGDTPLHRSGVKPTPLTRAAETTTTAAMPSPSAARVLHGKEQPRTADRQACAVAS